MAETRVQPGRIYTESDYKDFAHTNPGTLAGRYLRAFWQPVYRSEDIAPGWTKPIRIMGEDLTLYRGEGGAPPPGRISVRPSECPAIHRLG